MGLSKHGRWVYCYECGSRKEKNGVCQKCGHKDEPLLPGMVPDVTGLTEIEATKLLKGPEAQLTMGDITTNYSETVQANFIISSDPVAGTQLKKKAKVHIVVSLGPEA